jgi:hypothetical protein
MTDLGLYNYIKNGLAQNQTKAQITEALLKGNWTQSQIDEAFTSIDTNTPPIPTPPNAPENQIPALSSNSMLARDTNTSGMGKDSIIPDEIKKWSWGAFAFSWIWGLFNSSYVTLLIFTVPILSFLLYSVLGFRSLLPIDLGLPFTIWFGIQGNAWAWRNKRWDSIERFRAVQRSWAWAVLIFWVLILVIIGSLFGVSIFFLNKAQTIGLAEQKKSSASGLTNKVGVITDPKTGQPETTIYARSDIAVKSYLQNAQLQAEFDYNSQTPKSYGPPVAFSSSSTTNPFTGTGFFGSKGVSIFGDKSIAQVLNSAANTGGTIYYASNGTSYFLRNS